MIFIFQQSRVMDQRSEKEVFQLPLLRGFSKVDEEGKIAIPNNIRRAAELQPGQLVEVKIQGPVQSQYIVIHKRKQAR